MKRTISEVIDLIKQKKESAEREKMRFNPVIMGDYIVPFDSHLYLKYKSYEEAYTDILALLESSHLIEQEKALKMLKDRLIIHKSNNEKNYYGYFTYCSNLLPKEEYELLSEVFKIQ